MTSKPRFTRLVKDGKLWLRDRKATELAGPFDSWAEALAYMKKAEADHEQSAAG
jgi:hypothetical protein